MVPPTQSTSKLINPKQNNGSLSSIVSHLVRSSFGSTATTSSVSDNDLDKHVAEILLNEAKEKEKAWGTKGNKVNIDDDKPAPIRSTNKRFLTNMIRNVDDHNKALLRQEAEAARRREREEKDAAEDWRRCQRRNEADERLGGRESERESNGKERESNKDRDREESESERRRRKRREERDDEDDEGNSRDKDSKRRSRHHYAEEERRPEASRSKSSSIHERESSSNSRHRQNFSRSSRHDKEDKRSSSHRHSSRRSSHKEEEDSTRRSSKRDRDRNESEEPKESKRESLSPIVAKRSLSPSPKPSSTSTTSKPISSTPLPSFKPPAALSGPLPSKMDKYFSPTYDPLLDISLDSVTDPSTNLIIEGAYEGWDRMLNVVKDRKEEKEARKERERREKEGRKIARDKVRKGREKKKRRRNGGSVSGDSDSGDEGKVMMGMTGYAKQGGTREWDQGKIEQ